MIFLSKTLSEIICHQRFIVDGDKCPPTKNVTRFSHDYFLPSDVINTECSFTFCTNHALFSNLRHRSRADKANLWRVGSYCRAELDIVPAGAFYSPYLRHGPSLPPSFPCLRGFLSRPPRRHMSCPCYIYPLLVRLSP